jgi:predicted nucleic acid-binding protein
VATPKEAFAFVEALARHPNAVRVAPGERHWAIFRELVLESRIRGGDTTDAYLAALAMENDCEWWTTDGGFERFGGLRWRNLLSGS